MIRFAILTGMTGIIANHPCSICTETIPKKDKGE